MVRYFFEFDFAATGHKKAAPERSGTAVYAVENMSKGVRPRGPKHVTL
jgi:hypothetical protein